MLYQDFPHPYTIRRLCGHQQYGALTLPFHPWTYSDVSTEFLAASAKGHLFFLEPTDGCLRQVMFEPFQAKQKGWVVFINYMLLGIVSAEQGKIDQARRYRSNMRLALDNANIFLNPSLINIQTLATLAIHGEDFASPTQSWMLVGHACRHSEALALHIPARVATSEQQRRLCLFWLLFIIDKCCSLAFGRFPALPTSLYHNVPMPDYDYLACNPPHANSEAKEPQTSHFGANFYLRGFELCKLVGWVLEAKLGSASLHEAFQLRERLDEWWQRTNAVSHPLIVIIWLEYLILSRNYLKPSRRRPWQPTPLNSAKCHSVCEASSSNTFISSSSCSVVTTVAPRCEFHWRGRLCCYCPTWSRTGARCTTVLSGKRLFYLAEHISGAVD